MTSCNQNEKNPNWKGDKVKYDSLHEWVRNHKPKPELCEICNRIPALDLMNLDHKYKRNIDDYIYACRSCHMRYDYKMGFRKGWRPNKK